MEIYGSYRYLTVTIGDMQMMGLHRCFFFANMFAFFIAVLFLLILSYSIFHHVQTVADSPYMDEIFHIPQAQKYCNFNFSHQALPFLPHDLRRGDSVSILSLENIHRNIKWDPMITTLPGLYLSSLFILLPLASIRGHTLSDLCSTWNLRACNLLYLFGNVILLYFLSRLCNGKEEKQKSSKLNVMHAVTLAVMPVSYFFTWLYYTDPGSTFFTLLMYLLCLKGQKFMSAVIGLGSVLFRQTNIIWVLFCLSVSVIEILDEKLRLDKKVANLRKLSDWEYFKLLFKNMFSSLGNFVSLIFALLLGTFWYIMVICCFLIFVAVNGGIVVGDKTHHVVSFNFPQVFYFLLVSGAFSFSHIAHPKQVIQFLKSLIHHPIRIMVFVLVSGYIIQNFTYEHKYLLSDNRHYTFYVWSKIYRRHKLIKYILIPVYLYGFYQFYQSTVEKGFLWRVAASVCIVLSLIPQALLEFRYFIIPFYIIRLNMKRPSAVALTVELIFALIINMFTVYMFTQKPFYWPNDANPQRFMW